MSNQELFCICKKPYEDGELMIQCDTCLDWFHPECQNITHTHAKELSEGDEPYYCTNCSDLNQDENVPPNQQSAYLTHEETAPESPQEYKVISIIDHKLNRTTRQMEFLVKFADDTQYDYWIPEDDCAGCYILVEEYRRKHNLGPTHLPKSAGTVGASLSSNINPKNWVTTDQILKSVDIYIKRYIIKKDIPVIVFKELLATDAIYIIPLFNHCYVGLYLVQDNHLILSDGNGEYLKSKEVQAEISGYFPNAKTTYKSFYQQSRVDFCGSSASAIAIELKKSYQLGYYPEIIRSEDFVYQRLVGTFHKHDSEKLVKGFKPIHTLPQRTCPTCGKRFGKKAGAGLAKHIASCNNL